MDFINHPARKQLSTTGTTEVNTINPTVTIVKGTNYLKVDALFDSLTDLVNIQFKAWYCQRFNAIGEDQVMRFAATARQEAKKDKRRYFSYLLKHGV